MEHLTAHDIQQACDSLDAILAGIAPGELAAAPLLAHGIQGAVGPHPSFAPAHPRERGAPNHSPWGSRRLTTPAGTTPGLPEALGMRRGHETQGWK